MALKSRERNLSFDILRLMEENGSHPDPKNGFLLTDHNLLKKKRKKRNKKKQKNGKLGETQLSLVMENEESLDFDGVGDLENHKNGKLIETQYSLVAENDGSLNFGGVGEGGKQRNGKLSEIQKFMILESEESLGFEGDGEVENGVRDFCSYEARMSSSMVTFVDEVENGVREFCNYEAVSRGGGKVRVVEEGGNGVLQHGGELRQRHVGNASNGGSDDFGSLGVGMGMGMGMEENGQKDMRRNEEERRGMESNEGSRRSEIVNGRMLETAESLDWKQLITDPHLMENCPIETSPIKHFMEDLHTGHSLSSTVTLGNEKDRERVYDTIFRLPWRCELLIDVGFFVCFDSFLSVLTIMPVRMAMTSWKYLTKRQFHKPSAEELSDFGCLLVLASGVSLLQQIDISLIYHMIRGQGTIKLYVVYNVLEIFDKLFQSFVGDVMQTLFNSANGLAHCPPENMWKALPRFVSDEVLAIVSSIIHSFILLVQAITLSTCIVAHNNALFALLVSNNFAEIKSNVFKRFSKDNVHSIVYSDSVERFHICAFLFFVLAQNLLEAEGPWFKNFIFNALLVFICEVMIDIIKLSFIAKFNDIKPHTFSEFLEDLSKQTLNQLTEPGKRKLTCVPVAPACVVLRVLRPVFAAHLPVNPLPWRLFCMFLLTAMTFLLLGLLKIMVSMGLKHHASWYVKRCEKRKSHTD